jgi:hypothetical protein
LTRQTGPVNLLRVRRCGNALAIDHVSARLSGYIRRSNACIRWLSSFKEKPNKNNDTKGWALHPAFGVVEMIPLTVSRSIVKYGRNANSWIGSVVPGGATTREGNVAN